ncbi:MAG: efflux RND transporter periplasmic adaptor subunit [candidate division Zixibacteria bacterium CG_4_9_14_3_um_filter_46_8]|nr:MAG: efflux RND transporter periplasmic adaptor subunit [candidate division Zixibacteria bacterium CG_4_9_14_3_um_filter_46_8]
MSEDPKNKRDLSDLRISRDDSHRADTKGSTGKYLRLSLWVAIPLAAVLIFWLVLSRLTPSIDVKVATASIMTQNQAQSVLSATGYVVAQRQAAVASKATGRLEYLGVEEGDKVVKGQLIGRLENEDMTAVLEQAKAILAQARAESTFAKLEFNRQKQFLPTGATTQAEYEASEANYMSRSAAVKSAQAAVRSAEVALENTYIRAPFDGTVLTKQADVGEIVAPFASSASSRGALVDLADMSSLEVEADVSESNIQRVEIGQPCEIILDAYPDIRYKGHVKKIVPTADRSKATVMTKVSFDELDRNVLPEMSARVNFFQADAAGAEPSAVSTAMVPNAALIMRGDQQIIYAIVDNKARDIEVVIGKKLGNFTEITKGIRPGQQVIVSPPSDLKAGDHVRIAE